jgi:hypothetical protein
MNYLSNYSNLTLNWLLTNAYLTTNTSINNSNDNNILLDASEILYKTIVYSLTIPVFILTTAGKTSISFFLLLSLIVLVFQF